MSYYQGDGGYQGDYYQGDYYQGDPFFGALIGMGATWLGKKLLGRGARAAGTTAIARTGAGALVGGSVGAAAGVAAGALAPKMMTRAKDIFMTIGGQGGLPMPGGGVFRPTRVLPGGVPMTSPGCCPSGYHFNKAMTRTGAPPGTLCVRNRSMNVANPRALRRSLRRVVGFAKLASRARKSIKAAARAV